MPVFTELRAADISRNGRHNMELRRYLQALPNPEQPGDTANSRIIRPFVESLFPVGSFPPLVNQDNKNDDIIFNEEPDPEAVEKGCQLRMINPRTIPGYAEGSYIDLIYQTGVDIASNEGIRKVVWEDSVSLQSETAFVDLDGREIKGGAAVPRAIITSTARLIGAQATIAMQNAAGSVNDTTFRLWEPGQFMFMGATNTLISGSDSTVVNQGGGQSSGEGVAEVTMQFMGKLTGWQTRRPQRDAVGNPIAGQFDEFRTLTTFSPSDIFPSGWDYGS